MKKAIETFKNCIKSMDEYSKALKQLEPYIQDAVKYCNNIKIKGDVVMYNAKLRCISSCSLRWIKGRIYEVKKGILQEEDGDCGNSLPYKSLREINDIRASQFEEVKDKIQLLNVNAYTVEKDGKIYVLYKTYSGKENVESFVCINSSYGCRQTMIAWGKPHNTTLKDIQPMLDLLNIEIVEEKPKKFKLIQQEYDEETAEKLKELGLKLEEIK